MSKLLGVGDGRQDRRGAIGILAALDLSDSEVADVVTFVMEQRRRGSASPVALKESGPARSQAAESDVTMPSADRVVRLQQGQWAIHTMTRLGFDKCEIADLAGVDRSTVGDALLSNGLRSLTQETVRKLLAAVQSAGAERLRQLLPRIAITVLDTCCDKGRVLDEATRTEIEAAIRSDLLNALAFGSSPAAVIPGVLSFLARVGDPVQGLYVFKAPADGIGTPEERVVRLLLSEHELEHILQRFRMERWHLEKQLHGRHVPPNDGRIA